MSLDVMRLTEAAVEDVQWYHRCQKRYHAYLSVVESVDYALVQCSVPASDDILRGPDPAARTPKRQWEKRMKAWRRSLKALRVRLIEREQ